MAHCLWNNSERKHNYHYHLANWKLCSMRKEYGGLGVHDLRDTIMQLNICLLASWLKRYHNDRDKIWTQIIDHKYRTNQPNIFECRSQEASQIFKGFMCATEAAKMGYCWKIGNGKKG